MQVCHASLSVSPVNSLIAAMSHIEPILTSSGLYPTHALYQTSELDHNAPTTVPSTAPSPTIIVTAHMEMTTVPNLNQGTWTP